MQFITLHLCQRLMFMSVLIYKRSNDLIFYNYFGISFEYEAAAMEIINKT